MIQFDEHIFQLGRNLKPQTSFENGPLNKKGEKRGDMREMFPGVSTV